MTPACCIIPAEPPSQRGPGSPGLAGLAQGLSCSLLVPGPGIHLTRRAKPQQTPSALLLEPCPYLPCAKFLPFAAPSASSVGLGSAAAGRRSFPSGENDLLAAGFHGEPPQPAGGGCASLAALPLPRSVRGRSAGAAAPGRLLGNLSPPAPGAAPCWRTQPPLQSRVPAEHKSSPAAFSLSFFVSSDRGVPVSPGCSPLWQRPGAEARLPHLGCAEAAPGCARAPPAVPTVRTVPAPGLHQVKRSRWKWFVVEVEAGCSSFLRWRTPLPFVFDWRGSAAHLCCRSLTWAYVSDN